MTGDVKVTFGDVEFYGTADDVFVVRDPSQMPRGRRDRSVQEAPNNDLFNLLLEHCCMYGPSRDYGQVWFVDLLRFRKRERRRARMTRMGVPPGLLFTWLWRTEFDWLWFRVGTAYFCQTELARGPAVDEHW